MTMQVRADKTQQNVFHVDSAIDSTQRYTVTLEANDWTTGAHHCTCPAASRTPGRYCKHIVKTLQRITAKLPTAIMWDGYRYILAAYDYVGDPDDPDWRETSPFSAAEVFYQILNHAETFETLEPPIDEAQQVTLRLLAHTGQTLALVYDRPAQVFYVRNLTRETMAVIDTDSLQEAADALKAARWYIDVVTEGRPAHESGRYVEYKLTRYIQSRTYWANEARAASAARAAYEGKRTTAPAPAQ